MADTRPITRLTIKDKETGTETETDVKTCARGVTCDEGKTAQDHISDFVAHKKDVNRHVLVQVGGDEPATGPALWIDKKNLLHYKDKSGSKDDLYPATKAALVEGLSALLAGVKKTAQTDLSSHTSNKNNPHGVTAEQAGADPKGAAAAVQVNLDAHTGNKSNPHSVTKAQVGLGRVDNTSDADKPLSTAAQNAMAQLSDELEKVAGMTLLGGGAGGGELEDTALEAGNFVNTGAGWNTVRFREAFEGVPQVLCQAENFDGIVQVKSITAEGFLYCLRTLSTGSYYTGASTGTQPSHSATTLVSGTTTTATAVKIHYIAVEYGGER